MKVIQDINLISFRSYDVIFFWRDLVQILIWLVNKHQFVQIYTLCHLPFINITYFKTISQKDILKL